MITQERLKELLHYDPDTGVFTTLVPWGRYGRYPVGHRPGCFNGYGYRHLYVDGKRYKEHRLAVLYMTGEWPKGEVDHINQDKGDNRWANLRDVTRTENRRNLAFSGVYRTANDRYTAGLRVTFDTEEEALEFRSYLERMRDAFEARKNMKAVS